MLPLILLMFLIILMAIIGTLFYLHANKIREAKNYERGLKMVTLQIHLPPPSEDLEVGQRGILMRNRYINLRLCTILFLVYLLKA